MNERSENENPGRKILALDAQDLVDMVKSVAAMCGSPSGIPEDAKVIIPCFPYFDSIHPNEIRIVLESKEWPALPKGAAIPTLRS